MDCYDRKQSMCNAQENSGDKNATNLWMGIFEREREREKHMET